MKRFFVALLCVMLAAGAVLAEEDKDEAKRHFKQGAIFFTMRAITRLR